MAKRSHASLKARMTGQTKRTTLLPASDGDRQGENWLVDGVIKQGARRRAGGTLNVVYRDPRTAR